MTNKKYIFFIDIDDTLISVGQNEISAEIVFEIERLKKLEHIFVISTGRDLHRTLSIKGIEVFQYISALMGSCIYQMSNKQFLNKPKNMPSDEVAKLINYLNERNIVWTYKDEAYEKSIFTNSALLKAKKCKFVSIKQYNDDLANNKIIQLLFCAHLSKTELEKFSSFDFFEMQQGYTDVTLKNVSKARCVEFFDKIYPDMTTVSIGDSLNDLPMVEKTDISIAMGNASNELKKHATFVTKDINDHGLVFAFKNILKI